MTMIATITVKCPACGHEQQMNTWPTINVTVDPELKPRLLGGDLLTCQCESCDVKASHLYPMLYHDMDQKLAIWLIDPSETPVYTTGIAKFDGLIKSTFDSYTRRATSILGTLTEEIRIFDAGLDDRIIWMFRALFCRDMDTNLWRHKLPVRFHQLIGSPPDQIIEFVLTGLPNAQEIIPVPMQAYRDMVADTRPFLTDINMDQKWPRI